MSRAGRSAADLRVTVIIPAMNEARNLELVLPCLPPVHEVILVDGHSVDDTVDTARRILPTIKVLQQTRRGKGNALACGFEATTGDVIVMFDADGSADPAEIPRFVEALASGADFAKGSRFAKGGGSHDITRFRSLGNRCLNLVANLVLGTHYTDLCYGYNAFWVDTLGDLALPPAGVAATSPKKMVWGDGFEIETVLNCRLAMAKLEVREVPSFERSRVHGESNLNAISDGWRVLKTIATERNRAKTKRTPAKAQSDVPIVKEAASMIKLPSQVPGQLLTHLAAAELNLPVTAGPPSTSRSCHRQFVTIVTKDPRPPVR
jgi:glycosyltransferase involved in cell wall biosynthesis